MDNPANPVIVQDQDIHHVTVRLPKFIKTRPDLWCAQIEAQFETANITRDSTKFSYALQALKSDVLSEVSDAILTPPDHDKYLNLKTALLREFKESDERRFKQLLNEMVLGDQRSSRFLRRMKDLAENRLNDAALKSIWLQRLPTGAQSVLSAIDEPLDRLALTADRILDVVSANGVCVSQVDQPTADISSLETQINKLTKKLKRLETRPRQSRSRFRSTSRVNYQDSNSRSRTRSRSRSTTDNSLCWYHNKFGSNARKCNRPCSWIETTSNLSEN